MSSTCKLRWEAGLIVAGTINSSLRQIAFKTGVDFEIEKLGGFLVLQYGGTAVGSRDNVETFAKTTKDYLQKNWG